MVRIGPAFLGRPAVLQSGTVMADSGTDSSAAAPALTSRQRKWLRGRAHALRPVVLVGQAGVTDAVVSSVDAALTASELIKVRLHEPEDKHGAADALATRTGAACCGLIGHTVILYRPHPEKPVIALG